MDPDNFGSCGNVCGQGSYCSSGQCVIDCTGALEHPSAVTNGTYVLTDSAGYMLENAGSVVNHGSATGASSQWTITSLGNGGYEILGQGGTGQIWTAWIWTIGAAEKLAPWSARTPIKATPTSGSHGFGAPTKIRFTVDHRLFQRQFEGFMRRRANHPWTNVSVLSLAGAMNLSCARGDTQGEQAAPFGGSGENATYDATFSSGSSGTGASEPSSGSVNSSTSGGIATSGAMVASGATAMNGDAMSEAAATSGDAAVISDATREQLEDATSNPGDAVADVNDALSAADDALDAQDSSSCVPIASGLLGHWSMDNTTINGTQLFDTSGHGNNGTLVGFPTPATVPGKFGQALAYPSSGAYVNIPTLALDQSSGGVNSVSLWYYRSNNTSISDVLVLIPDSPRYDLWLVQTSALFLCINTANNDCFGVQDSTLHDRWVHVVAMFWNGPAVQSSLYIDGQNRNPSCQSSGFSACNAQRTAAPPVVLGGESSFFFQGWLDEVRVYNRALTETEVTALHNGTACP
jgi:hypothetical protein